MRLSRKPLCQRMLPGIYSRILLRRCLIEQALLCLLTGDAIFHYYAYYSLCLMVGKPPFGQIMVWSTEKLLPQLHVCGLSVRRQPYLRFNASLIAPLWRSKPCLAIGRTDNQMDAPFSWERLDRLSCLVGTHAISSSL